MKQIFQKRIFPVLLCLVFLLGVVSFAPDAAAAGAVVEGVISLSEPSKIFNDDDTVTVSYDIPVVPHIDMWGSMADGTVERLPSGSFVDFQNFYEDKTITTYNVIAELGVFGDSGDWNVPKAIDWSVYDIAAVTGITMNGVPYAVTNSHFEEAMEGYFSWRDSYTLRTDGFVAGSSSAVEQAWQVVFNRNIIASTGQYSNYTVTLWTTNSQLEPYDVTVGLLTSDIVSVAKYHKMSFDMYLFGECSPGVFSVVDISDIRFGAEYDLTFDLTNFLTVDGSLGLPSGTAFCVGYLDEEFNEISLSINEFDLSDDVLLDGGKFNYTITETVPSGASYMYLTLNCHNMVTENAAAFQWLLDNVTMSCNMSSIEDNSIMMSGIIDRLDTLVKEALETNESLDEIIELLQQIIADQTSNGCDHTEIVELLERITGNQDVELTWLEKIWQALTSLLDKIGTGIQTALDNIESTVTEIFTGGEIGDQLIAGGQQISDVGSGMKENLDQIQDFEDQYMADFDDNLSDISTAVDLTNLTAPLDFVWRYTNLCVAAVPSQYLVVFTLPALIGLFLFIIGHPVRAPRPDTSGDQVTRETFTETTILTGKHAGETRSTRTVTTTQEIGRVHNE